MSSVQNCKNGETVSVNAVGNDVGCARNNEFARFRFTTGMTEMGMLGEPLYRGKNALS